MLFAGAAGAGYVSGLCLKEHSLRWFQAHFRSILSAIIWGCAGVSGGFAAAAGAVGSP